MSFTLMRYKDGVPKPIKMSIWDAFKGVPSPKPRLHTCNGCKLVHKPGAADPTSAQPKSNSQAAQSQSKNKARADPKENENKDAAKSPFTVEEEAKLLVMRAENPTESWRVTLENLGKPDVQPGIAKARYKELQAAQNDKDQSGGASNNNNYAAEGGGNKSENKDAKEEKEKGDSKMTKKEKKAAKAAGNQDESAKPDPNAKAGKSDNDKAGAADASSSKSNGKAETSGLVRDNIKAWAQKYDKQKWVAAASKHFDLTGERITPQQAQKLAAVM